MSRDLGPFGAQTLAAVRKNVPVILAAFQNENALLKEADVILPASSYAEKEGTFTNFEGRVQRIHKVLEPLGQSRPSWKILADKLRYFGEKADYSKPEDIFNELARADEAFQGLTYEKIGSLGMIWNEQLNMRPSNV